MSVKSAKKAVLPQIPPIERPHHSPGNTKAKELPLYEEVQEFIVLIIVTHAGVGWLPFDKLQEEITKFEGWNTGQTIRFGALVRDLMHFELLERQGPLRSSEYRVTVLAAVKFLGWSENKAKRLGLKNIPEKEN